MIFDIRLWIWWNGVQGFMNVGSVLEKGGKKSGKLMTGDNMLAMGWRDSVNCWVLNLSIENLPERRPQSDYSMMRSTKS